MLAGPLPTTVLEIDNGRETHTITVQVASTARQRQNGLMGRESLPDDVGMLFVWDEAAIRAFWMKDTPLPLTVAFVAADGTITQIEDMEPYSETHHTSTYPAKFALEMAHGWFKAKGIAPGAIVSIGGEK